MKDLVVLYTGDIVYLSSISEDEIFDPSNNDLLFFNDGRVRRFKKNGIAYMAIFDEETNKFDSYRSEINFWNNNKINKNRTDTLALYSALGERFNILDIIPSNVNEEAKVILAHEVIYHQSLYTATIETETIYRSIPYKVAHPLRATIGLNSSLPDPNIYPIQYAETKPISPALTEYYNFIKNKKYLGVNGQLRDLEDYEIDILTDVIQVFNFIFTQTDFLSRLCELELNEPFDKTIDLINRYNHNYGIIDNKYHAIYNDEYFARLRLGLIEFKYWLIQYKDDYSKIDENDLAVYIVNLFDPVELSYLSYQTKINLLNKILKDNFWIIGNWGFNKLNEEEAILKIIRSIAYEDSNGNLNYSDIDKFMDFLNTVYDCGSNQTLYEVLYDRINDSIVYGDDGNGNQGQLVKIIYNLWQYSKFNPYHEDLSIANNALSHFVYTPYNCRWQAYDSSILLPIPDEKAAPMIINYESDKVLLWYIDNFKFEFYKNKIIAKDEVPDYGYQPYGVYNFFQPLSVKSVNGEGTIIKMPVLNAPAGSNPNAYIKNCIPAFYLMYIDELGDKSDAKETIGTAINVVLTFWGIGGVIANLRHIRNISLVARLGSLTVEEEVLLWRGVSALTSASEAFFGAASFFHDLATTSCTVYYNSDTPPDPNSIEYKKYKQCQSIDAWLFAFEMLSMSGDLLARRAFKRASRELAQNLLDDIPLEHKQVIDELAEIDNLLDEFLENIQNSHPNVYNKVTTFTDEEKKFAFMYDFKGRTSDLDELNSSQHLIDDWTEIEHLIIERKNIAFLKAYQIIKSETNLLNHIHLGDFEIKQRGGNAIIGEPKISGSHNAIALSPTPPPPLLPGKMSWSIPPPIKYSDPSDVVNSYTQGKIQRNMADLTDPMTGHNYVNGNGNSIAFKKGQNVYFPQSYSTKRINEEISYAHSQINKLNPNKRQINSLEQYTFTYYSKATDGHTIEIVYLSNNSNPSQGILQTIYPQNF